MNRSSFAKAMEDKESRVCENRCDRCILCALCVKYSCWSGDTTTVNTESIVAIALSFLTFANRKMCYVR